MTHHSDTMVEYVSKIIFLKKGNFETPTLCYLQWSSYQSGAVITKKPITSLCHQTVQMLQPMDVGINKPGKH